MGYLGESLLSAVFAFCGLATILGMVTLTLDSGPAKKILRWARAAMFVAVALSVAVLFLLVVAFLANDFSIAAVARYSSIEQGFFYKVSALWAGSAGSLLIWSVFVFILFGLWLVGSKPEINFKFQISNLKFYSLALSAGAAVCWSFVSLLVFWEKPFTLSLVKIENGAGLNPLLRNLWMVVHPPLLFVGYAAFLIPFVIVLAAVLAGSITDARLYRQLRQWLLFGICFLGMGIATGAKWSYVELGWGGYWSWDPVENASLLPWLVAVAASHSLVAVQRYGRFKRAALILSPLPFVLCLVATFITRSGILMSIHSYSDNGMSSALLVFIGCCFLLWLACAAKTAESTSAFLSSSGVSNLGGGILFWVNVIFIFTTVVIGVATFWPVVSRLLATSHQRLALTPVFYDRLISVVGGVLVLLVGLAALNDLRRRGSFLLYVLSSFAAGLISFALVFKVYQMPLLIAAVLAICAAALPPVLIKLCINLSAGRRVGGGIAHLGLLLLVATVGLSLTERSVRTQVGRGWKIVLMGYTISYNSFEHKLIDGITMAGPEILVTKKTLQTKLWPHNSLYPDGQTTSEVAVYTRLFEDVYVSFDGLAPDGRQIITVKVKPFMLWLWFAMLLIITGPALAVFEGRQDPTNHEPRTTNYEL